MKSEEKKASVKNEQALWNFVSLSDWQYKHFRDTVKHFLDDVNNLIAVQHTGIVPLILSQQNGTTHLIAFAPRTFEEIAKIDSSFALFSAGIVEARISEALFEMYDVVMGNKATYKLHLMKLNDTVTDSELLSASE